MCLVNSACGHKNVIICLAELQAWPVSPQLHSKANNLGIFCSLCVKVFVPRQHFCHNSFIYSTAQIKRIIESLESSQILSQQQHN